MRPIILLIALMTSMTPALAEEAVNIFDGKKYTQEAFEKLGGHGPKRISPQVETLHIVILSQLPTFERNITAAEFASLDKSIDKSVKSTWGSLPGNGEVVVYVEISPNAAPVFKIAYKGDFTDAALRILQNHLTEIPAVKSLYESISFQKSYAISAK